MRSVCSNFPTEESIFPAILTPNITLTKGVFNPSDASITAILLGLLDLMCVESFRSSSAGEKPKDGRAPTAGLIEVWTLRRMNYIVAAMHEPKLSIIMPVYNEAATLAQVVPKVLAAPGPLDKELVLIDDCSADGSYEIAEQLAKEHPQMRVYRHEVNQGKGAAIRTAIKHLRGDYAIIQDADLEYDPNEYGILLEPLLASEADVVYGSRFLTCYDRSKFNPQRSKSLSSSLLGNWVVTRFCNLLSGLHLTDMETCYKLIPVEILQQLPLCSGRFGIEPEITIRLAKLNLRIHEVPISYYPRQYHEGKKINYKDGLAALWHITRFSFWG